MTTIAAVSGHAHDDYSQPDSCPMDGSRLDTALVVDLDGTLIKTDLLLESTLDLLKRHPLTIFKLPIWLANGKSHLKEKVAQLSEIDPASLPYNSAFVDFLRAEHANGRTLYLATASHRRFAEQVADHLGIFDHVLATDAEVNLSGSTKLNAIVAQLGERQFDYAGNALIDLRIWPHARRAIVVNANRSTARLSSRLPNLEQTFPRPRQSFRPYLRAIRQYQWVKNLLVFVPLFLGHRAREIPLLLDCAIAFLAFSLAASSAYVLNDLVDLTADRKHPRKRNRPFASGDLAPSTGLWLAPALLLGAALLSMLLPWQFSGVLATYYLGTLAYSFKLKLHAMLDVMTLAGLYTLRIIGGLAAVSLQTTFWLLAFSVFSFLCLALIKRYSELVAMKREGRHGALGRGYRVDDLPILSAAGIASGYMAVLVLALYVNSPEVLKLYRTPEAIWLLCGLMLYWVSRIWMITHRGDMHDDPIVFTLRDGPSLLIGLLAVAIIVGASL